MEHDLNCEVSACSDLQVVERLCELTREERKLSVRLIVYLGEVEARGLYREQAFSSMFDYLVKGLHMSEAEAYLRLNAARLARQFPLVLELLASGAVHMSALAVISKFLTSDNHLELLDRVSGLSKRQVLVVAAELAPRPDVKTQIRALPQPVVPLAAATQAPAVTAPATSTFALETPREKPGTCLPTGPRRYGLHLSASQELSDKLEQLQHLLRHQVPNGDIATIVEKALDLLLAQTLKNRFAQTKSVRKLRPEDKPASAAPVPLQLTAAPVPSPQRKSRAIPHAVLREVYERDEGQCAFVAADGRRCLERGWLEVHHIHAFAKGGDSTANNLQLACRAHNQLQAEHDFGRDFMRRKQASLQRLRPDDEQHRSASRVG